MSALEYWLWLSGSPVGIRARAAILERYGDVERAFFAPAGELKSIKGVNEREAAILEKRDLRRAKQIREACLEQELHIITLQDAAYPKRLRHIYAPPPVLYVKGELPLVDENALIAVIGTRKASYYGVKMGRELAFQISKCGGVVVSLLTTGVDAAAAQGALLAGGGCIGVLGRPHESEKSELARDVAAYGALVSEYPPGMETERFFFRERNRIASGLSVGVLVVEAPEKSGTRLFANEANEQGKEIFAVPGNADASASAGTLSMIKEGARLVTCGWDVMSEFQALYPDKIRRSDEQSVPLPEEEPEEPSTKNVEKDVDKESDTRYIDLSEQLSALSEDQLKIIAEIQKDNSHVDDIIEATGLSPAKVLGHLTVMEVKGYIRRVSGKRVALNIRKK